MPRGAKHILTADAIKKQWENQEAGKPAIDPAQTIELKNANAVLQGKVKELEKEKDKHKYDPAGLRHQLEKLLSKHNIKAAFEPLIELALERYPDTHPVEQLRGQFVCTVDQRIKIWTDLLQYQMPKLKAVEVAGQIDNSITVIVRRFGDDTLIERSNDKGSVVDIPSEVRQVEEAKTPGVSVKKF